MANLNGGVFAELDIEMAGTLEGVSPISLTSSFNNDLNRVAQNFEKTANTLKM